MASGQLPEPQNRGRGSKGVLVVHGETGRLVCMMDTALWEAADAAWYLKEQEKEGVAHLPGNQCSMEVGACGFPEFSACQFLLSLQGEILRHVGASGLRTGSSCLGCEP